MKKVNDLFGKQVINQSSGERVAAVRDVVLSDDARRIVALVAGGGIFSNDERVIRWDSVTSVGDYVIVEGTQPFAAADEDMEVADLRKQADTITGKSVISVTGERVGTVGNMFFNDRGEIIGYEIRQGMLGSSGDNPILRAEHVQSIGKDAIIASSADLVSMHDAAQMWGEVHDLDAGERILPPIVEPREPVADTPHERVVGAQHEPIADVRHHPREPMPGESTVPRHGIYPAPREPFVDDRRNVR